ncbi:MAG: YraN family protein [Anaerolineales bacterium]|jgi:putative endonuclease
MAENRQTLGRWGENYATQYLIQNGYTIMGRNVRTSYGELDIIAQKNKEFIFIEVKTRSSSSFGPPENSINSRKRDHIVSSAQAYLQDHPELGDSWRVDVIAIHRYRDREPELVHFENVFQ